MHIAILTNEYPPYNYGGAGVHVEYLTRELARADQGAHLIRVLCFGDQITDHDNLIVRGVHPEFSFPAIDPRRRKFLDPMLRNLVMASLLDDIDIVHCHTWYTHLAGCLVRQLTHAKLILTTHSLEPHRPWKVEQLGTGYNASTWIERTAYQNADGVVAVSGAMRQDVHDLYDVPLDRIRVIHNGIDLDQYQAVEDPLVLKRYGVNPFQPYILFVGRITRQKGIIHLVNAIQYLDPAIQVVLCAGAPDTVEIGHEMENCVARARSLTLNPIVWIPQIVPKNDIITLYSHASLFVCPSVYEPFGIINLEAMACGTPVVASAVGGIREVVVPKENGELVPFASAGGGSFEPFDPDRFARDLAAAINRLMANPRQLEIMGRHARQHVERHFSWTSIARTTLDYYHDLCGR
jgi:glycogen synthase